MENIMPETFLIPLLGYLLGSIPFGLLLTRLSGLGDIRAIGSGNIGATNVMRTGRKGLAALTLLLDGLKGYVPVCIASVLGLPPELVALTAILAVLGHIFPVWLRFKGGKGVATLLGVLFGIHWHYGVLFAGVWLVVFALKRISSLSALLACIVVGITGLFEATAPGFAIAALAALVIARHKTNIQRLIHQEERGFGKSPQRS